MHSTTNALASRLKIRAASLRAAICRNGSYFGIKPIKLPNGRLLWPDDAFDRILSAGTQVGKEGEK